MLRVVKPKTKRAQRALDKRAPKLHESQKKLLLVQGSKSSAVLKHVLSDLYSLKKSGGNAIKLTQKNDNIRPFEAGGEASLEYLGQKSDCSLFAYASHSKKRPHNLVIGRLFDGHLYDAVELGVQRHVAVSAFGGGGRWAPQVGSKPCLVFVGEAFAEGSGRQELAQVKSLLTDLFRGTVVDAINLAGLDRVFVVTALNDKVWLRHCAIRLKKSGGRVPRVELIPAGPSLDLVLRRSRVAGEELRKEAMKTGKSLVKKRTKNVSTDSLAGKVGRIYMPKQEVATMALAKMKGMKRERRKRAADASEDKQGGAGGEAKKAKGTVPLLEGK